MHLPEVLRPMLELTVIIPAAILAFLPMKGHLRVSERKLRGYGIPALLLWAVIGGVVCDALYMSSNNWLFPWMFVFFGVFLLGGTVAALEIDECVSGGVRGDLLSDQSGDLSRRDVRRGKFGPLVCVSRHLGTSCLVLAAAGCVMVSGDPCRQLAAQRDGNAVDLVCVLDSSEHFLCAEYVHQAGRL